MDATSTMTAIAAPHERLRERYEKVRSFTEALAGPLSPEDQTVQTMPDVSPTKWHRAHTSWFFETFVLERFLAGYSPVDPQYRYLFNSYYEAVGPRHSRPERGLLSRPGADEVTEYRSVVDDAMAGLLSGDLAPEGAGLVELGLHHEQQHQELLLMDIKHVLSVNPLRPAYHDSEAAGRVDGGERSPELAGDPQARSWVEHPGGVLDVGHGGSGFAFDNEGPRHPTLLQPFALRATLTTKKCADWSPIAASHPLQSQ
jgi:ergothioneine biosynthesis protein EgtB